MILETLYLLVPAYIANMVPVLLRSFPWNTPMDFGLTLRGRRLLGDNKTWRGFIGGISIGILASIAMFSAYWPFEFSALLWGVCASAGALTGDAIKSFFKRQIGIKSGKPWVPFDQIDYSVGAFALGSLIYFPGFIDATLAIVISALGHIVVNHVAYYTGIRGEKW